MIARIHALSPMLLAMLVAPAAFAASPAPDLVPIKPISQCLPAVSLSSCQNAGFLSCPAAQDPTTGCGPILTAQWDAQYKAATTKSERTLLPQAMLAQTAPTAAVGTVFSGVLGLPPAVSGALLATGTGATYADDQFTAIKFFDANSLATPRYPWGVQSMQSCAEYSWKKWGTYSVFNDVVSYYGSNNDAIVNAATTPGYLYYLGGAPIRWDLQPISVNGYPMPRQGFQRNIFFENVATTISDPTLAAAIKAALGAVPGSTDDLPNDMPFVSSIDDFTFSNQTLAAHQAAGITDSHYASAGPRMAAYLALVNHYLDVTGSLASLPTAGGGGGGGTTVMVKKAGVSASETLSARLHALSPEAAASLQRVMRETSAAAPAAGGMHAEVTIPSCTPSSNNVICERQALLADLAATKVALGNALVAEWNFDANHGCLGESFNGHALTANYCDWSPAMFVSRYEGYAMNAQDAYGRCIDDTGDDFTIMTNAAAQAKVWSDPQFINRVYNDDLPDMENTSGFDALHTPIKTDFLDAYEHRADINAAENAYKTIEVATYEKATQDLPVQGPSSAPTAIGQSVQDSNSIGGDWFGGGYGYNVSWKLTPHNQSEFGIVPSPGQPTQVCRIDANASGSLQAHAVLFKQTVSLLDTGLSGHTGPGQVTLDDAHVTVFGNDLYRATNESFTGQALNVPIDATPASPSFSTIIPIMGVPVTVGAGASLNIGANLGFQASTPPTCDPNNLNVSLSASLTPDLNVGASVWAGIDLGVISAGIRANLTLIDVQLPVTESLSLANDPSGLALAVNTNASLDLTELSGSVDLYGEIDLGFWSDTANLTLFSWGGFQQNTTLFQKTNHYPIAALDYVFFNQVQPSSSQPSSTSSKVLASKVQSSDVQSPEVKL